MGFGIQGYNEMGLSLKVKNKIEEIWTSTRKARDRGYDAMKREYAVLDREIFRWASEDLPPLPEVVDFSDLEADEAAFTLWRVIVEHMRAFDLSPSWELMLLTPDREVEHFGQCGENGAWRVCYESGPYEWAIDWSLGGNPFVKKCSNVGRAKKFIAEPYYRFDICFCPS